MISLMQRIEELEARVREIEHDHADQEPLRPSR
jgi:BMFP domain-containing protein YqiC